MLLIICPWCGPRSETEFHCHGETKPARPDSYSLDEADWVDYLTKSVNPKGEIEEFWSHKKGCGEWFKLKRNTVTHQIIQSDEGSSI